MSIIQLGSFVLVLDNIVCPHYGFHNIIWIYRVSQKKTWHLEKCNFQKNSVTEAKLLYIYWKSIFSRIIWYHLCVVCVYAWMNMSHCLSESNNRLALKWGQRKKEEPEQTRNNDKEMLELPCFALEGAEKLPLPTLSPFALSLRTRSALYTLIRKITCSLPYPLRWSPTYRHSGTGS